MKVILYAFLGLILLSASGCKKLVCEWPLQPGADPDRCVEVRYDITGVYRGSHTLSSGLTKPVSEFAIWAYHEDAKIITLVPGTIECFLTGKYTFYVLPQTWGSNPRMLEISEGTGFVKDSLLEMRFVYTRQGDTISPPTLFTFRGFRPFGN